VALYQRALQLHPGSRRRLTISAMHSSSSADMRSGGMLSERASIAANDAQILCNLGQRGSVSSGEPTRRCRAPQALALDPTLASRTIIWG